MDKDKFFNTLTSDQFLTGDNDWFQLSRFQFNTFRDTNYRSSKVYLPLKSFCYLRIIHVFESWTQKPDACTQISLIYD